MPDAKIEKANMSRSIATAMNSYGEPTNLKVFPQQPLHATLLWKACPSWGVQQKPFLMQRWGKPACLMFLSTAGSYLACPGQVAMQSKDKTTSINQFYLATKSWRLDQLHQNRKCYKEEIHNEMMCFGEFDTCFFEIERGYSNDSFWCHISQRSYKHPGIV